MLILWSYGWTLKAFKQVLSEAENNSDAENVGTIQYILKRVSKIIESDLEL